jgi:large conductance mechanosensitive channel
MKDKFKGQVTGFLDFIRERGVMGLAIGFIMGGAVSKVTTSLSSDVINPALGIVFGSTSRISDLVLGSIAIGKFIAAIVDFFVLAIVVYVLFKMLGLDKLDKPKS